MVSIVWSRLHCRRPPFSYTRSQCLIVAGSVTGLNILLFEVDAPYESCSLKPILLRFVKSKLKRQRMLSRRYFFAFFPSPQTGEKRKKKYRLNLIQDLSYHLLTKIGYGDHGQKQPFFTEHFRGIDRLVDEGLKPRLERRQRTTVQERYDLTDNVA